MYPDKTGYAQQGIHKRKYPETGLEETSHIIPAKIMRGEASH